jgi:hypothetical protein
VLADLGLVERRLGVAQAGAQAFISPGRGFELAEGHEGRLVEQPPIRLDRMVGAIGATRSKERARSAWMNGIAASSRASRVGK